MTTPLTAPSAAARLAAARAARTVAISQMPELLVLHPTIKIPVVYSGENYTIEAQLLRTLFTKETLGLGNVDNTSDLDKPISRATQAAIDELISRLAEKANLADLNTLTARVAADELRIADLETFADRGHITADRVDGLDAAIDARINDNPALRPSVTAGPNDW